VKKTPPTTKPTQKVKYFRTLCTIPEEKNILDLEVDNTENNK
jgi:hypothetical protein